MSDGSWYGRLPAHWAAGNIRRFASMNTGHTPSRQHSEYWTDCTIPWFTLADVWQLRAGARELGETSEQISDLGLANSAAELLPAGTVVLSRTASVGFSGIMPVPMATSQDFWNWVPKPGMLSRFLWYQFQSMKPEFERLMMGSTHRTIYQGDAASLRIVAPPIGEQRAIADYLDRETAQVDAFIAKNEELITLLTERRAAVIARAVLRGLDASAELRASGVTWLGDVPSHWRVSRLSRWFEVTLGKMLDEAKFAGTVGDVLPYVRASNIKSERLDLSDVKSMPFTPSEQAKFSLRIGDLVVVEGGSIGVNAPIEEDMGGWGFQKTVNRVRAIRGDLTRFLGYQLDVIRDAGVLDIITNVSTIQHLTAEKLERIVVAMPPVEEQEAIVRHITRATSAIDQAISTAGMGVRLARERRAALISAAVTGKIDVGVTA